MSRWSNVLLLLAIFGVQFINSTNISRHARQIGCKFTIPADVPKNEPVYLLEKERSYELYQPTNKDNYLPQDERFVLFCPGNKNVVQTVTVNGGQGTGLNMTDVPCARNSQFESPIKRMNCTKSVMGDLRTTTRKCGKGGVINEIGFKVNARHFVTMFQACFSNQTASALYSRYSINGKAIRHNVKESDRRSFRDNGVPRGINPNSAYKRNNQINVFKELFGATQRYINDTLYLSRGHLAADADFVFSSGQFATYFYVNVAPQFQIVNGGNWLRVEKIARNLAMNYETDLTIYSGTLGQLRLPNAAGEQKDVFLAAGNKIIVPNYFYKIIIDEQAKSGIVFVTSNNPFIARNAIHPFCEDVCVRSGLDMKQFSDPRRGYTFCCEYDDFIGQVTIAPHSHRIQKLLSCSNIEIPE